MKIAEALQNEDHNLRVTYGGRRWLCGDEKGNWVVYERRRYAQNTTVVIETDSEDLAVAALLSDD